MRHAFLKTVVLPLVLGTSGCPGSMLAQAPPAVSYSFQFIALPFPGVTTPSVTAVNDRLEVVGLYWTWRPCSPGIGCEVGFAGNGTDYYRIFLGEATYTAIFGINNAGVMVGVCCGTPTLQPGFEFDPATGKVQMISFPGAQLTIAQCINDQGAICGTAEFPANVNTGFIFQDGTYTQVTYPGTYNNGLYGINSRGQAVGCATPDDHHIEGYLYQDGAFQAINYPGASATCAYGINNRGDVIGAYATPGTQLNRGFILHDGVYYRFDQPDCDITLPAGINDDDVIVGSSCGGPFIATPQP